MTDIRFETVEDMVKYALNNRHDDYRYELVDHTQLAWDDEELGESWQEEYNSVPYVSIHDEKRANYNAKMQEVQSRKPSMHKEITWHLSAKTSSSWHYKTIYLSSELGETINSIWTTKEEKWWPGHFKRSGRLSLEGILKRLGKTDVSKQIKAIEKEENRKAEIRGRNYIRSEIRKSAERIKDLIEKNSELGLNSDITIEYLLTQLVEESY